MINNIHSSDIELLMKMFVPKKYELHIFDPNSKIVCDKEFEFSCGNDIPQVLVNLASKEICCKQYNIEDFDFVFDFGQSEMPECFDLKTFHFINNPDKTMRWLFPNQLEKPSFLNFFNSTSIKARLLKGLIKLGFNSPFKGLLKSGGFKLYHKAPLKIEEAIINLSYDDYSIFTGTVGPNRKVILELNKNGATTHFVKVILNRTSLKLLETEKSALYTLGNHDFNYLKIPQVIPTNEIAIGIFSNIKPNHFIQTNKIEDIHLNALNELYAFSNHKETIKWSSFYEKSLSNLALVKAGKRFKESNSIANTLVEINNSLDTKKLIPVAIAHADFTPWNTYCTNDKLHVYDWELSQRALPMLFDLFHYVFQSGVLLIRQDYKAIKQEIDKVISNPKAQKIISKYAIDVVLHYKLYLLSNISYYMNLYEKQENLHQQAEWLIKVWNEALLDVTRIPVNETGRKFFMKEFIDELSTTPYAVLKFQEASLDQVKDSSDLDIVIRKNDLTSIIDFANNHNSVHKVKVFKKTFMTIIEVFFKDSTFLSIDLIHQFKRKSYQMYDADEVLKSARKNINGIMVPSVKYDLEYTCLFNLLNGASVPNKYQTFFNSFSKSEIDNARLDFILKYNLDNVSLTDLFTFNTEKQSKILNELKLSKSNTGFKRVFNQLNYLKDTLIQIRMKRGFTITFSGVDGAGKSTTIETIAERIATQFRRKVIILRHRPSILPILSVYKYGKEEAEQRAFNSLPRKGNNKNVISSTLRFAYYFTDYLFGQFYVFAKHIIKGEIVLYDRYYFDFINDAKRSNIVMPRWIVKMLFAFILKPRINVFLYASPEVILARKKELDIEAIQTLTANYRSLFDDYSKKFKHSTYMQIENIDLDETVETIMQEISEAA